MPNNNLGLFLETTSILDVPEKDFYVKLAQVIGDIEKAVNLKDTGIYSLDEFVCGKTFFPSNLLPGWATTNANNIPRQIWRKEFLIALVGGLPAGNTPIPHNLGINPPIQSIWSMTDIYGTTNDIINRVYLPLQYNGPLGGIALSVDANNININCTVAFPTYQLTYITLEYLKQ